MDTFTFIAGVCSILSLIISLFVANQVVKITNNLTQDNSRKQTVFGRDNKTAGNDIK
ncbi:hypothetical protein [Jeotgalibacillus salarius]|uniref:hypothetical protein n=1 Tax=Jeotgalibacillus salarius TaxID=546023 RepID=UPI00141B51E7|nr:hypothetical protein [Jeotgalibacillus salarius]